MKTLLLKDYKFIFDNKLNLIEVNKNGKEDKDTLFLLDKFLYVYSMIKSLILNNGSIHLFGNKEEINDLKKYLNM